MAKLSWGALYPTSEACSGLKSLEHYCSLRALWLGPLVLALFDFGIDSSSFRTCFLPGMLRQTCLLIATGRAEREGVR